jgi:hypothetical protein
MNRVKGVFNYGKYSTVGVNENTEDECRNQRKQAGFASTFIPWAPWAECGRLRPFIIRVWIANSSCMWFQRSFIAPSAPGDSCKSSRNTPFVQPNPITFCEYPSSTFVSEDPVTTLYFSRMV